VQVVLFSVIVFNRSFSIKKARGSRNLHQAFHQTKLFSTRVLPLWLARGHSWQGALAIWGCAFIGTIKIEGSSGFPNKAARYAQIQYKFCRYHFIRRILSKVLPVGCYLTQARTIGEKSMIQLFAFKYSFFVFFKVKHFGFE
jgi:hypothetical protein